MLAYIVELFFGWACAFNTQVFKQGAEVGHGSRRRPRWMLPRHVDELGQKCKMRLQIACFAADLHFPGQIAAVFGTAVVFQQLPDAIETGFPFKILRKNHGVFFFIPASRLCNSVMVFSMMR